MIDKETLLKKIENGETVYCISNNSICEIPLSKEKHPEIKYDCKLYVFCESEDYRQKFEFNNLFATKEEAEWVNKMHTTREERFEPPHWNKIDLASMARSDWWTYSFSVPKLHCRGKILIHNSIYVDWGYMGYCEDQKSFGLATQENYEKAVDFARKLFLEGAK